MRAAQGTRKTKWTITNDGKDSTGKTIYMVRRNGKPYSRAYSMSEARHLVLRYSAGR